MDASRSTYGPSEADVELERFLMLRDVEGVGTENGRECLAEGAIVVDVDRLLVVFEADAEVGVAGLRTGARPVVGSAAAAFPLLVEADVVGERLELQFEDAQARHLRVCVCVCVLRL